MRGWITIESLSSWVRGSPLFGFSLVWHCFLSGHRASEHSRLGGRPDTIWRPSVLADPVLDYRDANGNSPATNNTWKDTQQAQIQASGLAPPNDKESAIAVSLTAGNYTATLTGKNDTTGNALVEVYTLP